MSAIDDIIQGLDAVIEKVTETTTATAAVVQETEQALGQAEALGATAVIDGLTQVKDQLDALVNQIGGVSSAADEAQTTAKAVADST